MICWPKRVLCKFSPLFKLQGDSLSYVNSYKYLGYMYSGDGKDDLDIARRIRSVYALGNMVVRKFCKCDDICKILMFKTFCNNIYCGSLWDNYKVASYAKIKIAHNDIFRSLMSVPRYSSASTLFVQHRVNNLDAVLRNAMFSLMTRLTLTPNRLVKAIRTSEAKHHSRLWHSWNMALRGHDDSYMWIYHMILWVLFFN